MGKPAARVTDLTAHGTPLTPGPGSPNVMIGFLPAWRGIPLAAAGGVQAAQSAADATVKAAESATKAAAGTPGAPAAYAAEQAAKTAALGAMSSLMSSFAGTSDIHVCPVPTPVPPHGPGVVIDGSSTVLINNMPACTVGCTVLEALGGPDKITKGEMKVLIGDSGGGGGGGAGAGAAAGGLGAAGAVAVPYSNGPLSEEEAQRLFDEMASQQDIAFAYPVDGCYARAHIMSERMRDLGVEPSGKAWTFAEPGSRLYAQTNNDPSGKVEWGYHVAPTVQVRTANGTVEDRVIDPSLFNRPVTAGEWSAAQQSPYPGESPPRYEHSLPGQPPPSANGRGTGYWPGNDPPQGLDTHAEETMEDYKILEQSSRNSYPP